MKYKHTKKSSASIKSDTIFSWGKPIKQINVVIQKKTKKIIKSLETKKYTELQWLKGNSLYQYIRQCG